MSELAPRLFSDFDGTAVEKLSAKNPLHWPRNIRKYPLAGIIGYAEFLDGVRSSGVEIAAVVSRRGQMMERIRGSVTTRSVGELDLDSFFGGPCQVVLAGSEKEKGRFVAQQSRETVVGMLEDKPHKLGKVLLQYSLEAKTKNNGSHHPILIGVVPHAHSQEHIEDLRCHLKYIMHNDVIVRSEIGTNTGLTAYMGPLTVHVTQLESYSQTGGEEFGQRLQDLATT